MGNGDPWLGVSFKMGGINSYSSSLGSCSPCDLDALLVLWVQHPHAPGAQTRVGGGGTPQNLTAHPAPCRWLKDGLPLGAADGVAVSEDSGTLLIARVGLAHQGLYICQGSSRAGGAQVQVWVLVQGERSSTWGRPALHPTHQGGHGWPKGFPPALFPLWPARPSVSITEGDAVTVALRQPVTLRCQATGTPPPRLSWRKDGVPLPATGSIFQVGGRDGAGGLCRAGLCALGLQELRRGGYR